MKSELFFEYAANGNLTQLESDVDRLFSGQVGTVDYTLQGAVGADLLPSDSVFIHFRRPDGLTVDKLIPYKTTAEIWQTTSNGWETAFIPDEAGTNIYISFIVRRYSSAVPGRLVKTFTTEEIAVKVYPAGLYNDLDLAATAEDEILAVIGEHTNELIDHETRISEIEDSNPLVDFTSNVGEGYGTKYYFDGTTATVPLATGTTVPTPTPTPITTITFTEANWVLSEDGDYELAFSALTTGRTDNRYIAAVDILEGTGYSQKASRVYKGSDGSLLLSGVLEPYSGRILTSGSTVQIDGGGGGDGEDNVIEVVKRNGVALTVTDKAVDVSVPEAASDIAYGEGTVADALGGIPADAYALAYGETTVGDELAVINTAIGDISAALDALNGEVV